MLNSKILFSIFFVFVVLKCKVEMLCPVVYTRIAKNIDLLGLYFLEQINDNDRRNLSNVGCFVTN